MADNVIADPGAGGAVFATDDIGGVHYPLNKYGFGALDSFTIASSGNGTTDAGTQRVTLSSDGTGQLKLAAGTAEIGNVKNSGTFAVQSAQSGTWAISGVDAENAAATANPVLSGGRYDLTPRTLGDGDAGALALDENGHLITSGHGESIALSDDVSNTVNLIVDESGAFLGAASFPFMFDGTAWDRVRGDATNGLLVNLGSNNDISGTVTANAGTDLNTSALALESGGNLDTLVSGQLPDGHNVTVDNASIAVTNAGAFAVQEDGAALTALQLIDDPVFADDAAFTLTTSKTMVAGVIRDDNLSILAAAEGDVVPLRVNSLGKLHVKSEVFEPGTIDAFGHLLMNEAVNQVEVQFFRDTPANLLDVTTAGGGATSQVGGAGKFETSTAGTANAKGVTALSTSYRSASEIFTFFSVLYTTPTDANGFQRIGLYDDNDGVFIGFEGTTFGVTIRNGASDTTVAKASFSEDDLTGAVGSLFTRAGVPEAIDLTKFNVFRVRFGWLGAAPLFYEVLSPDDCWVTFHIIRQPNNAVVASMENPDLPMTLHVSKTGADATNLIMLTNCWAAGVTSGALPLDETLTDANLAKVSRTIISGKTAGGSYVNVQTTNSGNLKMALDEYDGVPIGGGTEAGSLRVTLANNSTGLLSVDDNGGSLTVDNASMDTVAGAVSGSEMQVDVVAPLPAGTTLIGDVGLSGARTSGGTTLYKNIDVDESEDQVKASAGQIYWIHAINLAATTVFLKVYNATAASVVVGTTVPDLTFPVPANSTTGAGFVLSVPNGIAFGTAITIAGTTGVADNDTGAPAANTLIVNLGFA